MKSFINYSYRIGKNFLLCQGPGGNTSIKIDNKILIKKSGALLTDAINQEIFKEVNLKNIYEYYMNSNKEGQKFDRDLSIVAIPLSTYSC